MPEHLPRPQGRPSPQEGRGRTSTVRCRYAAAAIVTVLGVVAPAVVLTTEAGSLSTPKTLQYETKLDTLTPVPVSSQASATPQPGDYVVISDSYLKGGKVVGTDEVHCTLITTKASLCSVAVSLPSGQLELQGIGPAGGTGHFTIAITGGTGRYAHVRGTATIISGADNTGTEIFRLLP